MRRLAVVIVAGSLVWGSAFAKGSAVIGGHHSAKAVEASRANLAKARMVEAHSARTVAQLGAAKANLVKARAAEAMKLSKKGSK